MYFWGVFMERIYMKLKIKFIKLIFVALKADEVTDVTWNSQFVLILRYMKNDKPNGQIYNIHGYL